MDQNITGNLSYLKIFKESLQEKAVILKNQLALIPATLALKELHRLAHSIKSEAIVMNEFIMSKLAQEIEEELEITIKEKTSISHELETKIIKFQELINKYVNTH